MATTTMNDDNLRLLLGNLMELIKRHGATSEEVRAFVREHRQHEEFVDLAAVCILAETRASAKTQVEKRSQPLTAKPSSQRQGA